MRINLEFDNFDDFEAGLAKFMNLIDTYEEGMVALTEKAQDFPLDPEPEPKPEEKDYPDPKEKEEPEKSPKEESKPEEKAIDITDMRAMFHRLTKTGRRDELAALLKRHGAESLSNVKPEDYSIIFTEAEAIING